MFDKMDAVARISEAAQKTERIVDHIINLIQIHENNAVIVYSSTLSSQIPLSHAAHAFNAFQDAFYRYELVRL
jgi:hypothetical protein